MKNLLFLFLFFIFGFIQPSEKVRIIMIGDSTMANKAPYDAPETGWGQVFGEFFTSPVEIHNYAVNGRSTKSFRTLGHWKQVENQLTKGDYVFIQFGHNDQKESDTTRFAAPQTNYRANLQRYVDEVKAKGAIPVIVSPVIRRKFDENDQFIDQHGEYPQVAREVAQQNNVAFIDLHASSRKKIEELGVEASKDLFMHYTGGIFSKFPNGIEDNTHFSPYGARVMAGLVAQELMQSGNPLRSWLKKAHYPNTYEYQLPQINTPFFRKDTFDVRNYGGIGNGIMLTTKAIQQAIDMANQKGGGTVLIPKGLWLTGPLRLKSNVNLHLADGALLQFSDNRNDYPIVETTWEGNTAYRCHAPIWGTDLVNVAITGKGAIDGAGQVWKQVKKTKLTESQWNTLIKSGGVLNEKKDTWYPSEQSKYGNENMDWTNKKVEGKTLADYEKVRDFLRPNMVSLMNCRNVLIEGVLLQNSPAWTLHPLLCKNLIVRNVVIKNPWFGQNNDALDIESCSNGIVEGCSFDTGDDAICIKSGRDEEGRKRGKPTENFIIQNNAVFHGHGGFVIGSEMSGGVKNLFIRNCNFLGTDIGLRFKTVRGRGGIVEKVYVSDINMNNIPGEAILFDMYYMAKDPVPLEGEDRELPSIEAQSLDESTPVFREFYIENIFCKGAETAIMLRGLPEMNIKNIQIRNSNFSSNKGILCIEAQDCTFENISLNCKNPTAIQVQNGKAIRFDQLKLPQHLATLFELFGSQTDKISLAGTDTKSVNEVVVYRANAPKKAFRVLK